MKEPYVVGLCGGSASGKTTVARKIIERIKVPWVVILSLDSFYKVLTKEQHEAANKMEYDFDSPNAIDLDLAIETLKKMKTGKTVKLMDLKIFVDTDSDLRLCRRVMRDMEQRGRDLSSIILQYSRFVKPNFDKHISQTINLADIVIPWSAINNYLIFNRSELLSNYQENDQILKKIYLIKQTNQVRILQTIIRDSKTDRAIFCHNARRLMKLCIIEAISLFKFLKCSINNDISTNSLVKNICTVSIMRAGEAFEDAAREILYEHSQGKILIQTNEKTDEPEFHYLKLPNDIRNKSILLFDATIASGAAAIMAIRVLMDHDVNEEDIIMTTLLLTPAGVQSIFNAFPGVKIVAAAIDNHVNTNYHIIPGLGNFGSRYFGT
ncbi:hypothetical protein HZS_2524 [Henneguya salminicola]|nr:hypothetical protein HZS_2524 [Henneguya salminicola]